MRVALLYCGYANASSVRPLEVARYLEARDHQVVRVDLLGLGYSRYLRLREPFASVAMRVGLDGGGVLTRPMHRWADVIQHRVLDGNRFDAVICFSFPHAYVLTRDLPCVKIYDCPTPAVDELELGGEYPPQVIAALREAELEIYRSADHVLFHWDTYREYVRRYVYDGPNLVTMAYGCHPKGRRAAFATPPRGVYLGYLGGYWANLDLLADLSSSGACEVDVYGFPPPRQRLGLRYQGVARDTSLLADYQLGLVTCSKDRLRRHGFSAKHLEYLSYGLPVLVPSWREHLDLLRGSVPYDEATYPDVVASLSDEDEWCRMSDLAYEQSKVYSWDRTLEGLEGMIG
jgi:hypothetical protein